MRPSIPTYGLYGEVSEALPDFWIHAESIPARSSRHNWEIGRHRHEHFYQVLVVTAGQADALLGEETQPLSPGSFVCVPEKTSHGFRFSKDIDGVVVTLLTDRLPLGSPHSIRLRNFVTETRILRLDPSEPDCAYLSACFLRIEEELSAGFGARQNLLQAYLGTGLELAAELGMSGLEEDGANRDSARIGRLNHLIGAHFREHLPVEFYARDIGVSVTHLNRITKAQTGRTMNELLSDRIIVQAKRDLLFTGQTAQEIAYALGFSDPAYFTRYFSREAGETPRQFRDRERGRQSRPKSAAS